jgi:hypothetical protein
VLSPVNLKTATETHKFSLDISSGWLFMVVGRTNNNQPTTNLTKKPGVTGWGSFLIQV